MQIAQDKYCKHANLPHTGGIPENWDPRLETLSGQETRDLESIS